MEALLRRYVLGFASNPTLAGQILRQQFESDNPAFQESAISLLRTCSDSPGFRYLLTLVIKNDAIFNWLCDPSLFTHEEACAIVRQLSRVEPRADAQLLEMAMASSDDVNGAAIIRILDILSEASDAVRIMGKLAQLSRHSDPKIRSKAILLMGRRNRNHKWVFSFLSEHDARTRANAVESLWGVDTKGARAVLWEALADADNRVVGNAVIGLYRIGDPAAVGFLLRLLRHEDAAFQATGLWAIQQTADLRFIPVLEEFAAAKKDLQARAARVLAGLGEKLARFSKRPARVLCHKSEINSEDGQASIQVSILQQGRLVNGLNARDFALFQGSALVEDYTVRHLVASEPIALAFVIPYSMDRTTSDRVVAAMRDALKLRRTGDEWTAIRYRSKRAVYETEQEARPRLAHTLQLGLSSTLLESAEDDFSVPAIRYSDQDAVIEDMLFGKGTLEVCAGSLPAAILAVSAAHPKHLKCHAIALLDERSQTRSAGTSGEIARLVRNTNAVLHIISERPSEFGRSLAEASGGRYDSSITPAHFPEWIERTCAALAGMYEIQFRIDCIDPAVPTFLQVAAQNGIGRFELPRKQQ